LLVGKGHKAETEALQRQQILLLCVRSQSVRYH